MRSAAQDISDRGTKEGLCVPGVHECGKDIAQENALGRGGYLCRAGEYPSSAVATTSRGLTRQGGAVSSAGTLVGLGFISRLPERRSRRAFESTLAESSSGRQSLLVIFVVDGGGSSENATWICDHIGAVGRSGAQDVPLVLAFFNKVDWVASEGMSWRAGQRLCEDSPSVGGGGATTRARGESRLEGGRSAWVRGHQRGRRRSSRLRDV